MAITDDNRTEFFSMMRRAKERCLDESAREAMHGYQENAQIYKDMSDEMWESLWWVARVLPDDNVRYRFPVKRTRH